MRRAWRKAEASSTGDVRCAAGAHGGPCGIFEGVGMGNSFSGSSQRRQAIAEATAQEAAIASQREQQAMQQAEVEKRRRSRTAAQATALQDQLRRDTNRCCAFSARASSLTGARVATA